MELEAETTVKGHLTACSLPFRPFYTLQPHLPGNSNTLSGLDCPYINIEVPQGKKKTSGHICDIFSRLDYLRGEDPSST